MNLLIAQGVRVTLGDRVVLEQIDFELAPAKVTLLAGRNGGGKTTLLNVLGGVHHHDSGEVRLGVQPGSTQGGELPNAGESGVLP